MGRGGANAVLDGLWGLADSEQKGRVIHEIAGAYKKVKNFDKTLQLSQYAVDRWPDANFAVLGEHWLEGTAP